jgi:hypothetical protein
MRITTRSITIVLLAFLLIFMAGLAGSLLGKYVSSNKTEGGTELKSSRDNPNGPYYHKIYSATSTDGLNWVLDNNLLFDHASVPGAIIKDNMIYVYYVDASNEEDQLSVSISADLGQTYVKHKVDIEGMPSYDAVDPHPELVNDKIQLYFLGDFMSMGQGEDQIFTMYSAVSEDGINFSELQSAYSINEITTDPDVFQTSSDWRMLVSHEDGMDLLISNDGLEFTKDNDFVWNGGGVSDTTKIQDTYYTYYCGQGISVAKGADTGELTTVANAGIDNQQIQGIICDPSVIQLPDNTYVMYYKQQDANTNN